MWVFSISIFLRYWNHIGYNSCLNIIHLDLIKYAFSVLLYFFKNDQICSAIESSKWYLLSNPASKSIGIMLIVAQRPINLSICGIYPRKFDVICFGE